MHGKTINSSLQNKVIFKKVGVIGLGKRVTKPIISQFRVQVPVAQKVEQIVIHWISVG